MTPRQVVGRINHIAASERGLWLTTAVDGVQHSIHAQTWDVTVGVLGHDSALRNNTPILAIEAILDWAGVKLVDKNAELEESGFRLV